MVDYSLKHHVSLIILECGLNYRLVVLLATSLWSQIVWNLVVWLTEDQIILTTSTKIKEERRISPSCVLLRQTRWLDYMKIITWIVTTKQLWLPSHGIVIVTLVYRVEHIETRLMFVIRRLHLAIWKHVLITPWTFLLLDHDRFVSGASLSIGFLLSLTTDCICITHIYYYYL